MLKVMLVEYDTNLREIYAERLSAEGYEIVTARDGEEALALVIKEKPNLIITDIMMPKISGFDFLDILRSTPETRDTKVVMMTALSQVEDKTRADKLGADRYLVKSQVTLEDVAKVVKEMLESDDSAATIPDSTSQPAVTTADNSMTNPVTVAPALAATDNIAVNPISPTAPTADTTLAPTATPAADPAIEPTSQLNVGNTDSLLSPITQTTNPPTTIDNATTVANTTSDASLSSQVSLDPPATDIQATDQTQSSVVPTIQQLLDNAQNQISNVEQPSEPTNPPSSEPVTNPPNISELESLAKDINSQYETSPQTTTDVVGDNSLETTPVNDTSATTLPNVNEIAESLQQNEQPAPVSDTTIPNPGSEGNTDFLAQEGIKVEGDPDLLDDPSTAMPTKSFLETVKEHLGEESANQLISGNSDLSANNPSNNDNNTSQVAENLSQADNSLNTIAETNSNQITDQNIQSATTQQPPIEQPYQPQPEDTSQQSEATSQDSLPTIETNQSVVTEPEADISGGASESAHQMTAMPPTTANPEDQAPAFDPTAPAVPTSDDNQTSVPSNEYTGIHGKIIQPLNETDKSKLSLAELYEQELNKAQVNAPVYNPPTGTVINTSETSAGQ